MSYTTNSTANRLKINKGWKNPSFPETLPLYSRDNVFFFKLYLFLKAYFTLKRTRLVYCDLRTSENYTKILYLVINSVPKKFKKKKSYRTWYVRRATSGLKYSPFRNAYLRDVVNLVYLDLPKLKKQVSAKLLPLSKQKLNKAFYTKTRYKSWINFLAKIKGVRKANKFYIKNHNLRFSPTNFYKLNIEQSLNFKLKRLKTQIIILNRFFSKLKQKKALTKQNIMLYKIQLSKLKAKFIKLNSTISKYNSSIFFVSKAKSKLKFSNLHSKINLKLPKKKSKKKYRTLKLRIKSIKRNKISKKSRLSLKKKVLKNWIVILKKFKAKKIKIQKKNKIKKMISKRLLNKRINIAKKILNTRKKISLQYYKTWVKTATLYQLKKTQFLLKFKELTPTRYLNESINSLEVNSDFTTLISNEPIIETQTNNSFHLYENTIPSSPQETIPTVLNDKVHQQLVFNTIAIYTAYLKEVNCINTYRTFAKFISLLKANPHIKHKTLNKLNLSLNSSNIQGLQYPTLLKPLNLVRKRRARRGGRNKFTFALLKKLRLKKKLNTDIRNFSKTTYKSTVDVKNVLSLVKKFEKGYQQVIKKLKDNRKESPKIWKLRETFRHNYKRHTTTLIKYQYKLGLQKVLQNYFKMKFEIKVTRPLAQFKNLKFLRLVYPIRRFQELDLSKTTPFKKTFRKLNVSEKALSKTTHKSLISLRKRYILMSNRTKRFAKVNSISSKLKKKNTYVFKNSANIFTRLRRKELLDFTQERLKEVKKKLIIRSFVPIASLFIKYLNPQILADHIAKEFEKTKYHQGIIFGLSQALRSLPFARAKGYRIAIIGRINSANKSRSYVLNRNVLIRQNFSKKVNFASSQARARIGSFGIKVWIFY